MPPLSTYTDRELLEAIRRDSQEAFTELFRRHWKKVHVLAYARLNSKEITAEIVQDIFISLWDNRASLEINYLSSYLYTAVKNRVLNYISSQLVREKYWSYYKKFIPVQEEITGNTIEYNELMQVLEDGIEHLPEKSKKVFRLNHQEGRSVSEIANILNLSEKAIQYHLTQSVKKLRLHLKDYMLTLGIESCLVIMIKSILSETSPLFG